MAVMTSVLSGILCSIADYNAKAVELLFRDLVFLC